MKRTQQYELIALRLGELHKQLKQHQTKMLETFDITLLEYHIICLIGRSGTVSQNDLAKKLDVDKALISRQIQNMEQKGLLAAEYDINCKRKKVLQLKQPALDLIPKLEEAHRMSLEHSFSDLSNEELDELQQIIEGVIEKI
ncbi:MAG: MarR family transcriptional regulator [Lachnospiraceae bacterium]|nr:MarR family transcriptional regulator [Candidatus Colinaster equi]